jgi:hypothetical protein
MYADPIVPFSGQLLDVPGSHPLLAPVTEDSMSIIIPAPPLPDSPFRYFELRVWRGWRFHYSVWGIPFGLDTKIGA